MARVPSFAQAEPDFRPLSGAAKILAVTGRACAHCGSPEIRPSNRRNALDILLACLFLAPFRCRICRERFYRIWRPSLQRPDPPLAPLLVMPTRRQGEQTDDISPLRVDPQPLELLSNQPPRIPPADVIAVKPAEMGPPPSAQPDSILILENDLSIRKLLRRLLERRGYSTVEISHAEELAQQLSDGRVTLLIADVSAAADTNVQTLVALARTHPSLKILALSAESLLGCEIPGRFLALPKPFPLDSFVDSVDRLLGR